MQSNSSSSRLSEHIPVRLPPFSVVSATVDVLIYLLKALLLLITHLM